MYAFNSWIASLLAWYVVSRTSLHVFDSLVFCPSIKSEMKQNIFDLHVQFVAGRHAGALFFLNHGNCGLFVFF